jgi:hypothetical protein
VWRPACVEDLVVDRRLGIETLGERIVPRQSVDNGAGSIGAAIAIVGSGGEKRTVGLPAQRFCHEEGEVGGASPAAAPTIGGECYTGLAVADDDVHSFAIDGETVGRHGSAGRVVRGQGFDTGAAVKNAIAATQPAPGDRGVCGRHDIARSRQNVVTNWG